MSLFSSVAVFFVIWWLALFVILPFGVRSQHEADDVALGTDAGAPHQPYLLRRFLATTALAGFIFAGVYYYFAVLGRSLEDMVP